MWNLALHVFTIFINCFSKAFYPNYPLYPTDKTYYTVQRGKWIFDNLKWNVNRSLEVCFLTVKTYTFQIQTAAVGQNEPNKLHPYRAID